MGCPHSGGSSRSVSDYFRRDVLKTALAVGGFSALAACLDESGRVDVPRGVTDPETLPDRQFAWNQYMARDDFENTMFPIHQLILFFDYEGSYPPSEGERSAVRGAFDTLDRAFVRGNGGVNPYTPDGRTMEGILYTFGYANSYFEGFEDDLTEEVGLYSGEELVNRTEESDVEVDEHDAALMITSDHAQVLLASELALLGEIDTLNGVQVEGSLDSVFELTERRTGFVGPGVVRRKLENEDIPANSPMSMGFVSGFADNQASEDRVALEEGPFEDGTLLQISELSLDLDAWYEETKEQRVDLMFSPEHTEEDVGPVGEFLGTHSGLTEEMGEALEQHAAEYGRVGHTQKLAASRDEDFQPKILRRSEAISTGDPKPAMNFTSLQRDLDDFVEVRQAMDEPALEVDLEDEDNGILNYHTVHRRGTYLVPPRSLIALPSPGEPS